MNSLCVLCVYSVYLDSVRQPVFLQDVVLQFDEFFTDFETNQLRGGAEHVTLNTVKG